MTERKGAMAARGRWGTLCGFLMVALAAFGAASDSRGALDELRESFPRALTVRGGVAEVEFCPDNTCDLFVNHGNLPAARMSEFAYLYIFFVSDYYVLENWRGRAAADRIANDLLGEPAFADCPSGPRIDRAKCMLRFLAADGNIRVYRVRYDEGVRTVEEQALP